MFSLTNLCHWDRESSRSNIWTRHKLDHVLLTFLSIGVFVFRSTLCIFCSEPLSYSPTVTTFVITRFKVFYQFSDYSNQNAGKGKVSNDCTRILIFKKWPLKARGIVDYARFLGRGLVLCACVHGDECRLHLSYSLHVSPMWAYIHNQKYHLL